MAQTILQNRDRSALTREQLARFIPSALAESAHESRSQRYLYVPTLEMIDAFAREGFEPVYAQQGKPRDDSRRGFTKHMIRFAPVGAAPLTKVGDTRAEIVVVNSHDGTSSVQLNQGVFRLACTNGLIVSQGQSNLLKFNHSAKWRDEIIEGTYTVLDNLRGPVAAQIEEMQGRDLSAPERLLLAQHATALRWDNGEAPIAAERMLSVRRSADRGQDAWTTLNVLQENALQGGIRYTPDPRRPWERRHTRTVTAIDDVSRINRGIWDAVATLTTGNRVELASEMFGRLSDEERRELAARLAMV